MVSVRTCRCKSGLWYDHSMGYKDIEVQRKFQREWAANRKREFYIGKYCVRCGTTERLELDHIDRTKKISHNIWSWSKERRETEISKCQILCHTCHWEKTRDDLGWRLKHGTATAYKNYHCRCSDCMEANRLHTELYRLRLSKVASQ